MRGRPTRSHLSVNQIVAYNLAAARELTGMTQDEAARRLEQFLGRRWSAASFSVAERSVDGRRAREFSANEIAAFAAAFGFPLEFFFNPPPFCERVHMDVAVVSYDKKGLPILAGGRKGIAATDFSAMAARMWNTAPGGELANFVIMRGDALRESAAGLRALAERLERGAGGNEDRRLLQQAALSAMDDGDTARRVKRTPRK